ncbi:MAG: hypothetical protein GY725_00750 [bacterium]|nr:hypothetical protein [bacterium]
MKLGFESNFVRRARTYALALLGAALLQPATASALGVDLTLEFPSQVVLGSSVALHDDSPAISTLAMTLTGNTLSFDNLQIHSTNASAVSTYQFLVLGPVSGTLNANGSYTTNAFDVQVTKYQTGGAGTLWTDTMTGIVLTTESSFRDCNDNGKDATFFGSRLGAAATNHITLVGTACPQDFGGTTLPEFQDASFMMSLNGVLPIVLPEPSVALLLGATLFALAVPVRSRHK